MKKFVPVLASALMLSGGAAFAEDVAAPKEPGALSKAVTKVVKLVKKPFRLMATGGKVGSAASTVMFAVIEKKLSD